MQTRSQARSDLIHEAIEKYANTVYRIAYARTRSKQDAEDIFQDVFMKLATENPDFASEENRKAWLIRVTVNHSINLLKSAWRRRVSLKDTLPEAKANASQPDSLLDEVLSRLNHDDRLAIHLHYYEDMPIEEIAAILKKSPSAVRMQLMRARKKLKGIMTNQEVLSDEQK